MGYKAVLYDLDGTLLDTADMNLIPLQRIIREELGQQRSVDALRPFYAQPGMKTMHDLGIREPEQVYARWVRYVNEYPGGAAVYPGVEALLKTLWQRGIPQGIVTSKKRAQYGIDFVSRGLDRYISAAVLEEDTVSHKPHPEPLLLCLRQLGVEAKEALYVGDSPSDCAAAHAAGMDFAFAGWGITPLSEIPGPDHSLASPLDLLLLL